MLVQRSRHWANINSSLFDTPQSEMYIHYAGHCVIVIRLFNPLTAGVAYIRV